MKTATLTFHAPNNNGSFLQAYALQQVLTKTFGVENDIIDYCTDKQIHQYSVFREPHSMGMLHEILFRCFIMLLLKKGTIILMSCEKHI